MNKNIEAYPFWFVSKMEELYPQQEDFYDTILVWEIKENINMGGEFRDTLYVNLSSINNRWFNMAEDLFNRYNKLRVFL